MRNNETRGGFYAVNRENTATKREETHTLVRYTGHLIGSSILTKQQT